MSPDSPDHYLIDHCIDGRVLYPATGYLVLAWRTLARSLSMAMEEMPVMFEDVTIHQATIIPKKGEGGALVYLHNCVLKMERVGGKECMGKVRRNAGERDYKEDCSKGMGSYSQGVYIMVIFTMYCEQ